MAPNCNESLGNIYEIILFEHQMHSWTEMKLSLAAMKNEYTQGMSLICNSQITALEDNF